MVELIVVVIILAVLAAAMAPRLAVFGGRRVRASAEAAAELLSVAARRDALTSQRVALDFDAEAGWLRLLTYAAPAEGIGRGVWQEDVLAPRVELGDTELVRVLADSVELTPRQWRIEFPQGGRRPEVFMVLADPARREFWQVGLPTGLATAAARPGQVPQPSEGGVAIDLDATGKEDEPW